MALYRRLRRQGGSLVFSLPSNLIELFGLEAGDEISISINKHDARLVMLDLRGRTTRAKPSKGRKDK